MYSTGVHVDDSTCYADFRSDTVTKPNAEMRAVMANAVVGDDVYEEDTTVKKLEETCASLFGKEAALFVVSGTMGNLISILAHTQRGDELIVGRTSHIHRWEQGNYARFAGVSATTVTVMDDGSLSLDELEAAIRVDDIHMPYTRLICLENTHNFAGGKTVSLAYMQKVRKIADAHGLLVHVDGARFYNAAVDQNVSVAELAKPADSVMMCFSKNLGAPVGSIIVGSKEFISRCRRHRKSLGGGWRQAGILAAAALYALENAEATIRNDHENAKYLSEGINTVTPVHLRDTYFARSSTNMVMLYILHPEKVVELNHQLKEQGILVMPFDSTRIRIVLNNGVGNHHIDRFISAYSNFLTNSVNGTHVSTLQTN